MIPVKLAIKGLYSYKNIQNIDFEKLLEGQIFGIFGGVGSGKSSILEAITFALYDQTERLNQKDKRNYNMMNLKSDEILIDFIFKAGSNSLYRFKVSATRKKNKEEVNSFVREQYKWINNGWVAESLDASEILGLSYDNFKRTVIIPQGKFQEFLQLTDGERVRMMKEIFQLEKFDLSDKVQFLISSNKLQLENIAGQLISLEEINDDYLAQKKSNTTQLENEKKNLEIYLNKLIEKEKQQYRLKQIYDQCIDLKLKIESAQKEEATVLLQERKLKEFEEVNLIFKNDLENYTKIKEKSIALQTQLENSQAKILNFNTEINKRDYLFKQISEEYNQREKIRYEYEDLEVINDVVLKNEKKDKLKASIEHIEVSLNESFKEIEKWEEKEKAGRLKLEETRKSEININELFLIKKWHDDRANIFKQLNELQNHGSSVKAKLLKIQSNLDSCIETSLKQIPEIGKPGKSGSEYIVNLRNCIKEFEREVGELRKESERLSSNRKLEDFIQHLHDGNACPLCGSEDHPSILNINSVSEEVQKLEEKRSSFENKIEVLRTFEQQITPLLSDINANLPILADLKIKENEIVFQLENHNKTFSWKSFEKNSAEKIDDLILKEQERISLEKKIISGLETVQIKLKESRLNKEEKEKSLNIAVQNHTYVASEINLLLSRLKLFSSESVTLISKENLPFKINELQNKYLSIEKNYKEQEEVIKKLHQSKELETGKMVTLAEMRNSLQAEQNELSNNLQQKLGKTTYQTLDNVMSILDQKIDIEKVRQEIQDFRDRLYLLKEQFRNLNAELTTSQFSKEEYEKLLVELSNVKASFQEKNKELIELKKEVELLEENLKRKFSLESQLKELTLRGDNLKIIYNLFRGHGFVNYISTQYLINLCNAANERFYKLTKQQLRLEVSASNDFVVRDFLNNGRVRSVKTLSGGQTFQASLCLALALADSVQQLNKTNQNFFFLDEGFGTLDKESLRLVFDTLKSLRKENRIVGVISHVEELQQEIDVFLQVNNDEEEGSKIIQSWAH